MFMPFEAFLSTHSAIKKRKPIYIHDTVMTVNGLNIRIFFVWFILRSNCVKASAYEKEY